MTNSANRVDIHVGSRVKALRQALGLSQEKLGVALGVTFQQIQKYEKGTNRISASRLQQIGTALGVPIGYFFEGLQDVAARQGGFAESPAPSYTVETASAEEGLRLMHAFLRITDPAVRERILGLVESLAPAPTAAGDDDEA